MSGRITLFAVASSGLFTESALAAEPARGLPVALSPVSMFMQADYVVKGVMLTLVAAAFVALVILFAKKIELARLSREARRSLAGVAASRRLSDMHRDREDGRVCHALAAAAVDEIAVGAHDRSATGERIALRFQRIEAAALREAAHGLGVLATIGATAPFIGLFGTVWGIMNSFIGIAQTQTTNLAVVAPGIAEALLATAAGLVAAVPAVIFYNHLTRALLSYRHVVNDVAVLINVLAGREIDLSSRRIVAAE
jgi:biopolymer transport protein ExbB